MGTFSIWHLLILMVFALLLFGRGKISELMGDVAKGIKSFKKGMADEETDTAAADKAKVIDQQANAAAGAAKAEAERKI